MRHQAEWLDRVASQCRKTDPHWANTCEMVANDIRGKDAEIARLKDENDLLKAALRWALENGATAVFCQTEGRKVVTSATAESYGHCRHDPPSQFAPLIAEAVDSKQESMK